MYEKKKYKILILDILPLLSILTLTYSILLSSAPLSSFYATLNFSNYNTALAFPPANQTQANNGTSTSLTVDTDKLVYLAGECVTVDGKVDKVIEGENVRLDFYGPDDKPVPIFVQFIQPNENGFFSYSSAQSPCILSDAKPGNYTFLATYNKKGVETKIADK
jgi:hypothetical protein